MDEVEATLRRSMEYLKLKTASHVEAWGLGEIERWDADIDEGLIKFSSPGLLVTAPVQVVGTYNSEDSTWMWGWDHPSVPEALARDALLVRDFGERHGLSRYTTPMIRCIEDEAWQFTALACHLAEASGAYRGPSGTTYVFTTFHDVTIHNGA
jgi:hypothetical protein